MSIRALQAVHTATFPAATTHPPRGPALVNLTGHDDGDGHDDATPKVSASQLLAALDQEIDEENRPHPGSPGLDPSPLGK